MLPVSASFFVQLFVFKSQKLLNLFLFLYQFQLGLGAVICFLASKCSQSPLIFTSFTLVHCAVFFLFNRKYFYVCSDSFTNFHLGHYAVICFWSKKSCQFVLIFFTNFSPILCAVIYFSVSKYSKFVLLFSIVSASFLAQLFGFYLQNVLNWFWFICRLQPLSLGSYFFLSLKALWFFLNFLLVSASIFIQLFVF